MKLSEYLSQHIHFSQESAELLAAMFKLSECPKGELLLTEGSHSKKVFFVEEGMMRLYYLKDGKDITHQFFTEGMFYAPIENAFLDQCYPYRLELLENSKISMADYPKIESFLDTDVKLQKFVRYLLTTFIKMLSERLFSIQFQSAQDRYRVLLENRPEVLLRAPLGHIASYLGITQSTLSVIRAQEK